MFAAVVLPLGALALVGGLYSVFYAPDEGEQRDQAVVLSEAERAASNELAMLDSDKDGLRDWEETLWETDPHNTDTDGDGTLDGDEIGRGRDPRKAGPDDVLEENFEIGEQQYFEPSTSTDPTEALAKNFFTEYLALKKEGDFNPANQQELVQNLVDSAPSGNEPRKYTLSDLRLIQNPADADRRTYQDQLDHTLRQLLSLRGNELIMFRLILEQNRTEYLSRLESTANTYDTVRNEMLDLAVPADIGKDHLAIINGLSQMEFIVRTFLAYREDPMSSIAALKRYEPTRQSVRKATENLVAYFTKHNIALGES